MKEFLDEQFLLSNSAAERLYHEYAEGLPIIDYHNHLPPEQIAQNKSFDNLTQIWLNGDHYKWRAMRTCGINERFITGDAPDLDKFIKWAETVPQTLRNPLYHWTHLELKRYFNITDLLDSTTALDIFEKTASDLQSDTNSVLGLLEKMNVETVCTTDDPLDSLEHHASMQGAERLQMLPTFRPDKAMAVENTSGFNDYITKLEDLLEVSVQSLDQYCAAIDNRHEYFHSHGCRLSDHGLDYIFFEPFTSSEVTQAFKKLRQGSDLDSLQVAQLKTYLLLEFAKMDHKRGWTQQFHLGALRNNSSRMMRVLGPDTGFDSISDVSHAQSMARFFDTLDNQDCLAKTIIYNLNPADNEVFASMAGNFNDGSIRGKVQFGSGWWFLDQLDGMEKQINALSNMGLLSCFVGMLTDSRSFLSFPRHEYFRRLLCDILGRDMEKGLIPNDFGLVGEMIANISYYNAKTYFQFDQVSTRTVIE